MHPLVNEISHLSENELEDKILKLNRAYFTTQNEDVRQQIILLLDTYKLEIESKRAKALNRNQDNGDNSLDNLINIS
jgi:hypothetical protein|tara:strand:- start:10 stop:240 length:231 start_codon:yes stop_codon:yes gene_type:complete